MAVCPFAVKKLIPPGSNDPRIKVRAAILHVADMLGPSLYDYFAHRSGGIESHFYVRLDGTIEQYRDTDFQADANLDANDFAVSIETEGRGAGEWTPEQLASLKRLLLWLHDVHGVPLRKIQSWDGSGVGYHVLFGSPSHWTPVAKSCPGPDRVRQFNTVLVPWMDSDPTSRPKHPNVTRALNAKTRDARLDALDDVMKHGVAGARAAAHNWLTGIQEYQRAEAVTRDARAALAKTDRGRVLTPNVHAALTAKTREARKAALRRISRFGSKASKAAAAQWLQGIKVAESALVHIQVGESNLRKFEK